MNKIKILLLALAALFGIEHACAQAVKVYKKDGTSLIVPYSKLEKIITRTQPLEWVDLGLPSGLKWATANVGADYPEDCGYYIAWGETSPKDTYLTDNSVTYNKDMSDITGNAVYDAAASMYDGARMPTNVELNELYRNCDWEWTTQHGVNGTKFTGPNGNSIFLPAAGYRTMSYVSEKGESCYFWTSTPDREQSDLAGCFFIGSGIFSKDLFHRDCGLTIRPVTGDVLVDIQTDSARNVTDVTADIPVTFAYVQEKGVKAGIEYIAGDDVKNVYFDVPADSTMTISLDSLKPETTYSYRAFVERNGGILYSDSKVFTTKIARWIDLGLISGVKWANYNVGAEAPEEYGDYFAWGEISPRESYTEENKLAVPGEIKHVTGDARYDAATANWGGSARMPTRPEIDELYYCCEWQWVIQNGVNGVKITGPNGNSIFLPAPGFRYGTDLQETGLQGYYWSSTSSNEFYSSQAFCLCFTPYDYDSTEIPNYYGISVRPVKGDITPDVHSDYPTNIGETTAEIPVTCTYISEKGVKAGIEYTTGDEVKNIYFDVTADTTIIIKLDSLKPSTDYSYRAFIERKAGYSYTGTYNFKTRVTRWVDLGLPSGVKWANYNVGATFPEQYGNHFAWGDISPKDYYDDNCNTLNKVLPDISGNPKYDAATANWGGSARMPTHLEMMELENCCIWISTEQNGVEGMQVIGPNGNSIFLPAAGYRYHGDLSNDGWKGYYWNSTPIKDGVNSYEFKFELYGDRSSGGSMRYYGEPVRPVSGICMLLGDPKNITVTSADIPVTFTDLPEGDFKTGVEYTLDSVVKKVYADVNADGDITAKLEGLEASTIYNYRAFIEFDNKTLYSVSKQLTTNVNTRWVDLGLMSGTKWANFNIGATLPEESGDYFAWGEITPKDDYTNENSLTFNMKMEDITGNPQYDAATANWGSSARMPTKPEMDELYYSCEWKWTVRNNVYGYTVTGPNGNSIFLPASGYRKNTELHENDVCGRYWESTTNGNTEWSRCFKFVSSEIRFYEYESRSMGLSVRPVSGDLVPDVHTDRPAYVTDMTADIPITLSYVSEKGVKAGIEYTVGNEVKTVYADVNADTTITIKIKGLNPDTNYKYRAFVERKNGNSYTGSYSFKTEVTRWVDLGLPSGIKWAKCNLGARHHTYSGHFYAWGEITSKESYDEGNSITYGKPMTDISGDARYDAATANLGGSARIPTKEEIQELIDNCTWQYIIDSMIHGMEVTGPNGNKIFIPAVGNRIGTTSDGVGQTGYFWSSTPYEDDCFAYDLYYIVSGSPSNYWFNRSSGLPIRPVSD